jgi:hypothetical protein
MRRHAFKPRVCVSFASENAEAFANLGESGEASRGRQLFVRAQHRNALASMELRRKAGRDNRKAALADAVDNGAQVTDGS